MVDTSKDGLLLRGGIRYITATSYFTRGSKQVPACVRNIVETRLFHRCKKRDKKIKNVKKRKKRDKNKKTFVNVE